MAPIAASLAQSESKSKFFARLGLSESNKMHRHIYSLMKSEAIQRWQRMSDTRDALVEGLKDDALVVPPYTFGQIDEAVMAREIRHMYSIARPETRPMYQLGQDQCEMDGDGENWIIRWLLWHVFRYRDDRNSSSLRRGSQTVFNAIRDGTDDFSSDSGQSPELRARKMTSRKSDELSLVAVDLIRGSKKTAIPTLLVEGPEPAASDHPYPVNTVAPPEVALSDSVPVSENSDARSSRQYWDPVREALKIADIT